MANTTKQSFLDGNNVTVTDKSTGSVITVERAGFNRFYVSYNDTTRVVPFMVAYQVISEESTASIDNKTFIYHYTPTTM